MLQVACNDIIDVLVSYSLPQASRCQWLPIKHTLGRPASSAIASYTRGARQACVHWRAASSALVPRVEHSIVMCSFCMLMEYTACTFLLGAPHCRHLALETTSSCSRVDSTRSMHRALARLRRVLAGRHAGRRVNSAWLH